MKNLLPAAGYLALYVILDWVSYIHPVLPLAITPWNPQSGLSLAFLLIYGIRNWPALFVAALAAEVLVRGIPAPLPSLAASSAALAGCYMVMAALLAGPLRIDPRLGRLRDLTRFLAAVLPGTLAAAVAYVGIYTLAELVPAREFFANILRFWVGDMIGVMVVTPFILIHAGRRPVRRLPGMETISQASSILLALWIIFGLEFTDEFKFFYLLFLPLIWVTMRRGIQGASVAILAIQIGLIAALQWTGHKTSDVLEFQLLMLTLAITGLFLGMAVSGRREVEEQLREQQAELGLALRLAAVGEMASALAHELNQPLSALSNYVRACQLMLAMPADHRTQLGETMDKAVEEVRRASRVVHRLRDFYRAGVVRREQIDPEQLLRRGIETLAVRAARHGISLRMAVDPNLVAARVDRVQIESVLHNLISNAIDAVAAQPTPREITVEAAASGAETVRVCVTDTGPGVPPEMRKRVFDPFASGKSEGTGLGLAISRSLVEANGGKLWLEDQPKQGGARFCFTIPVDGEEARQHG